MCEYNTLKSLKPGDAIDVKCSVCYSQDFPTESRHGIIERRIDKGVLVKPNTGGPARLWFWNEVELPKKVD